MEAKKALPIARVEYKLLREAIREAGAPEVAPVPYAFVPVL